MESDWLGRAFNFDACEGRLSNGVRVSAAGGGGGTASNGGISQQGAIPAGRDF